MRVETFPGGSYIDVTLEGDVAVLFKRDRVEFNRQTRLPVRPRDVDGPIHFRLQRRGAALDVLGQGQGTGLALFGSTADMQWRELGPSPGVWTCAFGPDRHAYIMRSTDRLEVVNVETGEVLAERRAALGSQGIRYIDPAGVIVTGDASQHDPALHLNEFVRLGDLVIGQGNPGAGVVIVRGAQRKRLADGLCFFIHAYRLGDLVAVCWWESHGGDQTTAHARWFTVAEVAGLPADVIVSERPPQRKPEPTEEPTPVSTPQSFIDLIVRAGRTIDARFPGLRERDGHAWAKKVGYFAHREDARAGLKGRNAGHLSVDTFGYAQTPQSASGAVPFFGVSIIRDNPPINEWRAQPHDYGLIADGQWWITPEPVDVGAETPGGSKPGTGVGTPTIDAAVLALVDARIAGAVAPLRAENAGLKGQLGDALERIAKLEARPITQPAPAAKLPSVVALRSVRTGKLLCNDVDARGVHAEDRENAGPFEQWGFEVVE